MRAVLAKPQVKDFLKTLAKGKKKGQEQRKEHDVNAHAVTAEGEPSKKPWEEDIPESSSPSYSPPTSFSYSSDSSSFSNPRRRSVIADDYNIFKRGVCHKMMTWQVPAYTGSSGSSTADVPAEAYDPGYEMENMPIESMDTAVSGTACGNRESELVTETKSKKDAKEKIYANKAFDSGAKADNVCRGNLDLATVLPFQMSKGELGMAKLSETLSESAKRKRKVAFSSANDVEGEDLSSASLSLENSARSVEKSCNMFSRKGEELISSVISIAKENVVVACKATAKKKRKQKRRGRNSIARSKRSTKSTVAKVRDLNNVPLESIEAAVSEGAFENKDSDVAELKKIKNSEEEKNHASEVFAETTADAGAEADKTCREIVYLATAQRIQTDEGELAMEKSSKTLHGSSLKKRKVAFCSANDMEGRDLSSAILNLEFSARSMEKSCSWLCEDKDEVISSVVSVAKQKGVVAKKAIAKRKGMHKRTGRLILASSERSSKPTAQVDIEMSAYAGKQPKDFFDDKQLAGGLKKTKSIMLKERQVAADAAAGKTAEPVSDFISTIRTRGASQKLNANKGVQTKSILKDDKSFAKLQDLSSKTNLNINPNMKSALLHPVAVGVANLHGNVPVISRPQKQGGKHLDEAKSSKRLETMDSKTSTFVSDPLKENCSAQSYDGLSSLASVQKITKSSKRLETLELKENCSGQSRDGIGLSSMASAQKRMKQMLPPPLPSPLMSVSRQLVSKAFGLKTSKSGRLLVPPLAHWRGQSVVRDMDGGIIAIEDGSNSVPAETGCFNFKPPIEARAKKLQEWLSETASKCLSKKLTARRKGNQSKLGPK
ncbi:hypothetical protein L7F22_028982 [Adiantum nelumboides]|nr:hypothetical protein [Adiantum nelumboides]